MNIYIFYGTNGRIQMQEEQKIIQPQEVWNQMIYIWFHTSCGWIIFCSFTTKYVDIYIIYLIMHDQKVFQTQVGSMKPNVYIYIFYDAWSEDSSDLSRLSWCETEYMYIYISYDVRTEDSLDARSTKQNVHIYIPRCTIRRFFTRK